MKKILLLLIGIILLSSFPVHAEQVTYNLAQTVKINKIVVNAGLNVHYVVVPGATTTDITVKADSSAIKWFSFTITNGKLTISPKPPRDKKVNYEGSLITVTSGVLSSIETNSGAFLCLTTPMDVAGELDIECNSASKFTATKGINCKTLDLEASSGATVTIKVNCEKAEIEASSAARVTASGKASMKTEVEASSAANVTVSSLSTPKMDIEASSCAVVNHSCPSAKVDTSSGARVLKK